ncbi:hypothetical protein HELRODRAFT_194813 [Helobdella robusta]|uniref:Uncharacterized protein n=1 Tax=Helobdella robusta TaxID=6412 RepID=T1FWG0_HELRO|nr:hypothetical protein HELRODRAFT_194813 [Helobdella robusta]ESO11423.1 hypothetical protein HELRODRAFT_194813 [Helobdella robusta]
MSDDCKTLCNCTFYHIYGKNTTLIDFSFHSPEVITLCIFYCLLFICALAGNIMFFSQIVLSMTVHFLTSTKVKLLIIKNPSKLMSIFQNVFVWLTSLAMVISFYLSLISSSAPSVASDSSKSTKKKFAYIPCDCKNLTFDRWFEVYFVPWHVFKLFIIMFIYHCLAHSVLWLLLRRELQYKHISRLERILERAEDLANNNRNKSKAVSSTNEDKVIENNDQNECEAIDKDNKDSPIGKVSSGQSNKNGKVLCCLLPVFSKEVIQVQKAERQNIKHTRLATFITFTSHFVFFFSIMNHATLHKTIYENSFSAAVSQFLELACLILTPIYFYFFDTKFAGTLRKKT